MSEWKQCEYYLYWVHLNSVGYEKANLLLNYNLSKSCYHVLSINKYNARSAALGGNNNTIEMTFEKNDSPR